MKNAVYDWSILVVCSTSILSTFSQGHAANLLFSDTFTNSSLNTNFWNPFICDVPSGGWPWNMQTGQPQPSSAIDKTNAYAADYELPSLISTGAGLQMTLQSGTTATGYTWSGSIICSYPITNAFSRCRGFTFTNGYAEVRAKFPGATNGCWSSLWFLAGPGSNGGEIDLHEGGYLSGSTNPDQIMACNFHSAGNSQKLFNTGTSLSADYHVYGMEYLPGRSVKMFFDGVLAAAFTNNVTNSSYYLILNDGLASGKTAGWHSQTNAATASPSLMFVDYVKVYDARPLPRISSAAWNSKTNLIFSGTNGTPAASYRVLCATNLQLPLLNWQAIATNHFDLSGQFCSTNSFSTAASQKFFTISVP